MDEFIIPINATILEYNYSCPLINIEGKTRMNVENYGLNISKVEITNNSLLSNLTHTEYKMKLNKSGQLTLDKIIHNKDNNNIHSINGDNIEKSVNDRKELVEQSIFDILELHTNSTKSKDVTSEDFLNDILANFTDIEFFEVPSLMNNSKYFYEEKSVPFKKKKMDKYFRRTKKSSILSRYLEFNIPINESKNSTVDFTTENTMLIFENSTKNIESIGTEQNTDIDILKNKQVKPSNLNKIDNLFLLKGAIEEDEAYYKNFLEPIIKEVSEIADISYRETLIVVLVYSAIKPTIPKITISTVINELITNNTKLTGKNWIHQCPAKIKELYRSAEVVATINIQLICDDLLKKLIILSNRCN
ncbi:hypothetical protein ACR3K2_32540 [Cryptosporidium serpentis]